MTATVEQLTSLSDTVQTVEVKFRDEKVGSLTDKDTTHTLYRVAGDAYVVHVDEGEESWLETNDGQGLSEAMLGTFFPQLAEACVGEQVSRTSSDDRWPPFTQRPRRSMRSRRIALSERFITDSLRIL